MIANLQNLKPGSLIFFRHRCSFFSWFMSWLTGFKYSNIAVYLGDNKVLESCWFNLKSRHVSVQGYLNNDMLAGEVITLFSDPEDIKLFIDRIKRLRRNKYLLVDAIQKALFGLEIEVTKKTEKFTIKDIYNKVIEI